MHLPLARDCVTDALKVVRNLDAVQSIASSLSRILANGARCGVMSPDCIQNVDNFWTGAHSAKRPCTRRTTRVSV